MSGKQTMLAWLIGIFFLLPGQNAMAATEGGAILVPNNGPQSEIYAGVVVDYMGKLKFLVLEEGTNRPIVGASIEISVPQLSDGVGMGGQYVLVGMTDENGILELDVAYSRNGRGPETRARGNTNVLYTPISEIKYQVYKVAWEPYSQRGQTKLKPEEIEQVETIFLSQQPVVSGGGSGGDSGGKKGSTVKPTENPSDQQDQGEFDASTEADETDEDRYLGLPKTGVEGTAQYWIAGLLFFLIAGGIAGYLLKCEKNIENNECEK